MKIFVDKNKMKFLLILGYEAVTVKLTKNMLCFPIWKKCFFSVAFLAALKVSLWDILVMRVIVDEVTLWQV